MATTRIMPLHIGKGRTESRAISDIIDYVANPQKTDNGKLITGYGCDSRTADAEFLLAKRQYIAATGRVRGADDVIAYHVRQSFKPGEITPEEANRLGVEFAKRFTKGNHAFVVCTHIDKSHVHNHIIWSAVNTDCDRKFRNFWGSTRAVRRLSDTICIENGLSIVENPKPHGKSYNKWLGEQAKPSHREQLRVMIDRALEQKPADFDALLKLLSEMGCEVSRRGKVIRLKAPGWKNVARMDNKLGAGYSEAEIRAVLAGEKQHTPRKKSTVQPEPPKVNLLVDIQAKLQAGKGAGYARWAKVFNLKQMAQTVNFLTEHQLLDYAELAEKAAAATAHHNELSAQIKAAEKRMAEIAVLRTHIINYAKTRETYVAYRKAGYSKKFREEHEEEIAHFHLRYGNESVEALMDVENWAPTFYAADATADEIKEALAGHSHEHEEETDEHVWTSPKNAIEIVDKITSLICGKDPKNDDSYEKNSADYKEQLEQLDASFREVVDSAKRKTILFGDRFPFRYFADEYGLSYYAAFTGCSTETEASAATVAFLTDKVKEEQIPVVFTIELSNGKIADSICEATGAKKMTLYSCHNVTKEQMENGATYLSMMTENVDSLRAALN